MPLYFNLWTLLTGAKNEHMFMDWKPEEGSLVHIVSHRTGQVGAWVPAWVGWVGRRQQVLFCSPGG